MCVDAKNVDASLAHKKHTHDVDNDGGEEKNHLFICEMTFTRNDIQREFIGWVSNEIISHLTMIIQNFFQQAKGTQKLNVISKKERILIAIDERQALIHL